ncbi:hypothetical protein [Phaeocystidibacter marisrubri]|nr:hypothetical protein [Phaeocystidibacter marisrubri]
MHKKPKPISYTVPKEGSLALLALGAVGIRAWREAKQKAEKDEE